MTICGPNRSLTRDEVAQYMRNAGFPESAIQTGLAVAYGESGWQSGNCNLADANGGSYGLWQINGVHFYSGGTSKACAFDPQCATNYAYSLWKGQGWNPWGAYTDGRYLQFMGGAVPPGQAQATNTSTVDMAAQTNPIDALSSVGKFFTATWDWLTNPVRIIKMIVGLGLVLISVAVLFLPQAEESVTKVATTVTKIRHPVKVMKAAAKRGARKAGIKTGKTKSGKAPQKGKPKP